MSTNKRFTMDEDGNITDTAEDRTLYVENLYTECKYFTNLLNELNNENSQFREVLKELKSENKDLKFENEKKYREIRQLEQMLQDVER